MREILFRGKWIGNDELVYGALYVYYDFSRTIVQILKDRTNGRPAAYEVYPETVGQYTGLTDKNGKRIFEGDIVRFYERQFGGEDAPVIQSVGYEEGGFCVHRYFLNNWLRNAIDGNIQLEGIEVIGNIHDNPELLEVETT